MIGKGKSRYVNVYRLIDSKAKLREIKGGKGESWGCLVKV